MINEIIKKIESMVRCKLLILSVFCMMFLVQGCVHGDLDDCPPMVQYAVAFQYTNHTGREGRFYDDVKKINLYVFDEHNLIYTTMTELSPYEENFNIPLDLPMGNYHIIAWGNVLDDEPFSITPDEFVTNETTLEEARLILQKTAGELNNTELEKLFYGERYVEIPLYISRIDTISLVNNTNNVRVVLRWDHSRLSEDDIADPSKVTVRLKGINAKYKFDNSIEPANVIYAPFATYMSDSVINADKREWLKINYYSDDFEEISRTNVYDFKVLRLFKDVPFQLVVEYNEPLSSGEYLVSSIADVDIINRNTGFEYLFSYNGISESQWQNTFDKNEYYRVDMYIIQGSGYHNSFVTGSIKIKDWWKIGYIDGGGAD